jgi:hypothetical protein
MFSIFLVLSPVLYAVIYQIQVVHTETLMAQKYILLFSNSADVTENRKIQDGGR